MRSITVLVFACACALASGSYKVKEVKYADSALLLKQKVIFELLQNVHQDHVLPKLYEESKTMNIREWRDQFDDPKVVDTFMAMWELNWIEKDDTFTLLHAHTYRLAKSLFEVFYNAKDWDTFHKTINWARFNVNRGMFLYVLQAAVLHRKDLVGIVLPAPYELNPYHFFNSETIQLAQQRKMQGFYGMKKVEDVYTTILPTNYTGWYVHTNVEQKLSYFNEDVGLNSYYLYFHLDYPFWLGGEKYGLKKDRRGEFYLYQHQQLLARYYMERLSNDLGEIPELSYWLPIASGYNPALRYYNGEFFPSRENNHMAHHEHNFQLVLRIYDYERRIRDAIDQGYVVLPDGSHVDLNKPEAVEILGNLIQGNEDSVVDKHFYGLVDIIARKNLGSAYQQIYGHQTIPSVLDHFDTAMRDPVFWQLYKRLMSYYAQFNRRLGFYKQEDILFKGVKIDNVEIDKLVTYFDRFDSDITNAVDIEMSDDHVGKTNLQKFGRVAQYHGEDILIKARQWRLNHLPFTFKLHATSDKAQKAVVKVYVGPKHDEFGHVLSLNENRENFYELEHFMVDLVEGKNDIVRNSEDFSWFVKDRTSYYELYKQLMLAVKGEVKWPMDMTEAHCGFPNRLMLPKGKKGGMQVQFFFMLMPYNQPKLELFSGYDSAVSCGVGSGARYVDTLPFGFPFNRPIDETIWYTPNMYYYDANIFLKRESEINAAH